MLVIVIHFLFFSNNCGVASSHAVYTRCNNIMSIYGVHFTVHLDLSYKRWCPANCLMDVHLLVLILVDSASVY